MRALIVYVVFEVTSSSRVSTHLAMLLDENSTDEEGFTSVSLGLAHHGVSLDVDLTNRSHSAMHSNRTLRNQSMERDAASDEHGGISVVDNHSILEESSHGKTSARHVSLHTATSANSTIRNRSIQNDSEKNASGRHDRHDRHDRHGGTSDSSSHNHVVNVSHVDTSARHGNSSGEEAASTLLRSEDLVVAVLVIGFAFCLVLSCYHAAVSEKPKRKKRGIPNMSKRRPVQQSDADSSPIGSDADGENKHKGLLAKGKERRGETADAKYKFGDLSRGVIESVRGSWRN